MLFDVKLKKKIVIEILYCLMKIIISFEKRLKQSPPNFEVSGF